MRVCQAGAVDPAELGTVVALPDPALVVLVGASGSGKSVWAAEHYRPDEVVSSGPHTLYFGGNAITMPIIVLSIYVVIGAALVLFFSWGHLHWKGKKEETSTTGLPEVIDPDEQIATAAIPPG